jgi:hypothetical protein
MSEALYGKIAYPPWAKTIIIDYFSNGVGLQHSIINNRYRLQKRLYIIVLLQTSTKQFEFITRGVAFNIFSHDHID